MEGTGARRVASTRRPPRIAVLAVVALMTAMLAPAAGAGPPSAIAEDRTHADDGTAGATAMVAATEPPATGAIRDTAAVCPAPDERDFDDLAGSAHEDHVRCLAGHGLTEGLRGGDAYGPRLEVTRGQMASFLVRFVEHHTGEPLPVGPPDRFVDVPADGYVHAAAILALAEVEIVAGTAASGGDAYDPQASVTRAQLASLLRRALTYVETGDATATDVPPDADVDRFPDDDGSVHEPHIDAIAAAGIVQGHTDGTFRPSASVRRDTMASFLMRAFAYVERDPWHLQYQESFDEPIGRDLEWQLDDRSEQLGPFDDDGEAFHVKGGPVFTEALGAFETHRASQSFGQDGWLTVELSTRDRDQDGQPSEAVPSFTDEVVPDVGSVGAFDVPSNTDGVVLRPTDPLPERYRIEYELVTLDFGGLRDGVWDYDGLVNGYGPDGCKTQHPWTATVDEPSSAEPCDFPDVRGENGFYFLGIVDHEPAPRNNVFIHDRRKVVMDQYQVTHDWGANYEVCDPTTGELYGHHDLDRDRGVPVNMLFLTDDNQRDTGFVYNEFMMETDCGFFHGSDEGVNIVSVGELQPELMPASTYRFAIERTATGYVQEIAGPFVHGEDVLRFERDFVQDGHPIWHYNQRADEYDGAFDTHHVIDGPYGSHEVGSLWPEGSAYPDYFLIGIPHSNYYEGSASIADLRLYVPDE